MRLWGRKRAAQDRSPAEGSLHIRDLIRRVQQELVAAQTEREQAGQPALFEVSGLTLEVNFVAQQTTGLSGGVDLKVVTAGGTRSYQNQQIHRITLTLGVVPPDDGTGDATDLARALARAGDRRPDGRRPIR